MGFSWKSESLGLESLCLVNTGSVCLRRNAGAVKDQEGGVKEVATYSAEIPGLRNTYFFLVEVIFGQFFKTTAAALTCATHAAVLYFVLY